MLLHRLAGLSPLSLLFSLLPQGVPFLLQGRSLLRHFIEQRLPLSLQRLALFVYRRELLALRCLRGDAGGVQRLTLLLPALFEVDPVAGKGLPLLGDALLLLVEMLPLLLEVGLAGFELCLLGLEVSTKGLDLGVTCRELRVLSVEGLAFIEQGLTKGLELAVFTLGVRPQGLECRSLAFDTLAQLVELGALALEALALRPELFSFLRQRVDRGLVGLPLLF